MSVAPETFDDDPFVTGLMTTPVVAISADARLPVALRVMAAEHVRHLVVVDRGRCVGLLQEGEVARLLLGPATPREVPPLPVGAVCRTVPRLAPGERRSGPPAGCTPRASTPVSWPTASGCSGSSPPPTC
jgi:CBS domain-containing protein